MSHQRRACITADTTPDTASITPGMGAAGPAITPTSAGDTMALRDMATSRDAIGSSTPVRQLPH